MDEVKREGKTRLGVKDRKELKMNEGKEKWEKKLQREMEKRKRK